MVAKKKSTVPAKSRSSLAMFDFEIGVGSKAKRVCVNLAHVSEIVWDMTENADLAKLVMASGEKYDLNADEAAAILRRLKKSR